jgi:lipopolysaccharide export LptBFGC system permease protein LptF
MKEKNVTYWFTELGIRYFLPFSLFADPLLQCSYSLSLLRYFSEICNTLFAICYSLFATSFEQCNRLYISELLTFYAGLWIRIDFNLDPVRALDFWGF